MKRWRIETTEGGDVYIHLPEFMDTYFGDTRTLTPEEWTVIYQISAAPALLEACKAALAQLTGTGQDGTYGQHPDNPIPAQLRAALALVEAADG